MGECLVYCLSVSSSVSLFVLFLLCPPFFSLFSFFFLIFFSFISPMLMDHEVENKTKQRNQKRKTREKNKWKDDGPKTK